MYCIFLISSLELLLFLSYWDGEATFRGGLLNEEGTCVFVFRYYCKAEIFCGAKFLRILWIGMEPRISVLLNSSSFGRRTHYTSFADNSIIIELLKVNCRDT